MSNPAGSYPKTRIGKNVVRTMDGRYGIYVLVDDLQQALYKDALRLQKDGLVDAATYAEQMAENLGNMD